MKGISCNVLRSALSIILAVCMVLGMCSAALATGVEETKKYVSLGDSMTNGYGLLGYDGNTGVEDYGNESYANQFAEWLGANHAQLAMSAMRAEDLHWLLEVDYDDPAVVSVINTLEADGWDEALWYSVFTTGDYWTWAELINDYRFDIAAYCIEEKDETDGGKFNANYRIAYAEYNDIDALKIVAEYYQTSVTEADVVSLSIGNGNFGVFMFGRITEAIGFNGKPEDTEIWNIENVLQECDPETQELVYQLMSEVEIILADNGIVADNGDDSTVSTMEALYNVFMYTVVSYALNYAGSVEAILQLNPDAEIIQVALMNTIGGEKIAGEITLSDLLDMVFVPLNAYIAALPTYMQGTQNSVYDEAKFYFAEAPYVECIVDTYVSPLEGTVRDRFVESIVGENGSGMVWGMLGSLVVPVTSVEIAAYEALDDNGKMAYAAENTDKAKSIAIYLAFEKAVIANRFTPVTVDSIMGLGGAIDFEAIMTAYGVEAAAAGADKLDVVAAFLAGNSGGMLSDVQVKAILNGGEEETAVYYALVEATAALPAGTVANVIAENEEGMDFLFASVAAAVRLDPAEVAKQYNNGNTEIVAAVAAAKQQIVDGVATAKATVASYNLSDTAEALCTLLVTPDVLAGVLSESEMKSLLALFGRCVIGNGIGSHPSAAGHDALAEAVINAYDNDYTSADKTLENAKFAAEYVAELIVEYYDEAYAYAYTETKNAGYIDDAISAIDDVIDTLTNIDLSDIEMTEEFRAEVTEDIEEIVETLEAAKALLVEADVLDQATLNAVMATLDEGGEAIQELVDVLVQAGVDVNNLVIIPALEKAYNHIVDVVIPDAIEKLQTAVNEATEIILKKIGEAYDAFVEAVVEAAKKYAPEVADWIYDYLYNNPAEIIAFFKEYGDDIAEFLKEYGNETLAVIGFILTEYGEDIAALVLNNADVILTTMIKWVEEHGENAWDLIEVYLDELGVTDTIGNVIDKITSADIEGALNAVLAIIAQYSTDAAEALKEIIKNVEGIAADVIAKAEEFINVAEDLKAQLEDLYAELEDLYAELEAAAPEIKAEIEAAIAKVEAQIKVLEGKLAEIEAQINDVVAAIIAAYENTISGEYTANEDSYYVAIGNDTAYAELLAEKMELDADQFVQIGEDGITVANITDVLGANSAAEIANSDLVTVGFGNSLVLDFVAAQISNPTELDWGALVTEDGVPYVDAALAEVEAYILESGIKGNLADILMDAIEAYAYGYTAMALSVPGLVEEIHEINPNTLVVIIGMYNPLEGVVLTYENIQIPVGEYVGYLVDAANAELFAYALLNENTMYVDTPDVDTSLAAGEYDAVRFVFAIENYIKASTPTADGYEYIKMQILSALDVTVEEVEYILGDVDLDGDVDARDAAMAYAIFNVTYEAVAAQILAADVDGNGVIEARDAAMIYAYHNGTLEAFPAA